MDLTLELIPPRSFDDISMYIDEPDCIVRHQPSSAFRKEFLMIIRLAFTRRFLIAGTVAGRSMGIGLLSDKHHHVVVDKIFS